MEPLNNIAILQRITMYALPKENNMKLRYLYDLSNVSSAQKDMVLNYSEFIVTKYNMNIMGFIHWLLKTKKHNNYEDILSTFCRHMMIDTYEQNKIKQLMNNELILYQKDYLYEPIRTIKEVFVLNMSEFIQFKKIYYNDFISYIIDELKDLLPTEYQLKYGYIINRLKDLLPTEYQLKYGYIVKGDHFGHSTIVHSKNEKIIILFEDDFNMHIYIKGTRYHLVHWLSNVNLINTTINNFLSEEKIQ